MKNLIIILAVLGLFVNGCNSVKDLELEVLSLNIRYDNPADGNNAWPFRKDLVVSFINEQSPDIFGLQEALWHQYRYIDSLAAGYLSIGAGRSDGEKSGEMTPVFFKSERFDLLESDTFWLSETPDIPGSKGWGAVLPRIVTWVKLNDRDSGKDLYLFNTHYSHMSDSARLMSSVILLEKVQAIAGDTFFVITGDFNMLPDSKAYITLTEGRSKEAIIGDTYHLSETEPSGPGYTFNGFNDNPGRGRIDYVFSRSGVSVKRHTTFMHKSDSLFISDHWPVKSTIVFTY